MAGAHLALYGGSPPIDWSHRKCRFRLLDTRWPMALCEKRTTRTTVRRLEVGILRMRLPVCRQFCRKSAFGFMRHFGSSTYRSQDEDRRRRSAERRPGGGGASPVVRGRRMRGRGILTVALSSRIFLLLSLRPWRRRRARRWWHICYFGRFVVLPTEQSEKDTRSNPY